MGLLGCLYWGENKCNLHGRKSNPNIWWAEGQTAIDITSPRQYFKFSSSTHTELHFPAPKNLGVVMCFYSIKCEKWSTFKHLSTTANYSLVSLLQSMFPNGIFSISLYCRGGMETFIVLRHWESRIVYSQCII